MSVFYTNAEVLNDSCSIFEGVSKFNFAFSVLITIGIFISYLPQYHRIYVKRTSEGLSTNFLLLGSCSSIFTLTNIILVTSHARDCCSAGYLGTFNCISSQLSLIQIGIQCISAIMILVLCLAWTKNSIKQDKLEYEQIVQVGKFVTLHGLASLLQIIVGLAYEGNTLRYIANINGLLSTTLTIVKYVPQIHTTYRLKHPGTLSIGMMCIQTPGGAVFTLTLFFTNGSHWSSWISYFVAFILQGTLLSLCIYYEYFKNHGADVGPSERREIEHIVERNITENALSSSSASHEDSPLL